ncbi:hypothetical protein [Pontimicrobium sp. IMCC45349]|uniref:hypothetical protein n=1 Tax=Pontimicrobium sp. IMCC45349 TaxID=3391574 RepID=UPI0039A0B4F1
MVNNKIGLSLNDFPSLENYKKNLQSLKELDFRNLSFEELRKAYFDQAKILPYVLGNTSHTIFSKNENNFFYRARIQRRSEMQKEDSTLIQNFSFPPPSYCSDNGRANLKNTSVFYCSNTAPAALNEVEIENGSEGFLGVWELDTKSELIFNLLMSNDTPESNSWSEYIKERDYNYKLNQKLHEGELSNHMDSLRKFINDVFMYENKPYWLSSFLANRYLYGNDNSDFIVYPSAKSHHDYVNYAFHPNAVLNHLKLSRVFMFRINEINDSGVFYTVLKVGYLDRLHIKWKSADDSDLKYIPEATRNKI